MSLFKAVMKIKCDMETVSRLTADLTTNGVWQTVSLVERFDENQEDWYFYTKLPFPFHPRDVLLKQWIIRDPKRTIFCQHSTTRTDSPVRERVVRGIVYSKIIWKVYSN
jgi:hypothetical protein